MIMEVYLLPLSLLLPYPAILCFVSYLLAGPVCWKTKTSGSDSLADPVSFVFSLFIYIFISESDI